MSFFATTRRAAATALAGALIVAPVAHASAYGPAMSASEIRAMQTQGVREIIVMRAPGVSTAAQAALRAQAGVSYAGPGPLPNTELDSAPAGQLVSAVATLEREPGVQYAEPDGTVQAAAAPNDPYFSQEWALANTGQSVEGTSGAAGDDIKATYVWPHTTGSGVTVAVVDTGADSTAPDLQGQLVPGYSWVNGGPNTQDANGHGTHVTGIIAAAQNNGIGVTGVAPGARVMPLQVLDASGSGSDAALAEAFAYAGQHGVRIVNASLGGSTPSQTVEAAIGAYPNTLYVVPAGNGAADDDNPATPFYPCDLTEANVICVGASDQNDRPASFSNYGAGSVDLFAPGVNILSTWLTNAGGYAYADGTSMAAPMVSGTLALMLARNPSLSAAQLKADLLASVDQRAQLAGLALSGGALDAAVAVATAGGDPPYAAPATGAAPAPESAINSRGSSSGGGAPATRSNTPLRRPGVRLTRVAMRGRVLAFTLSARTQVHVKLGSQVRVTLSGRNGANRYSLSSLLRRRALRRGRYSLTVSAGGRAVTLWMTVS